MASAAARAIHEFIKDTNIKPQNYDLILTGDLGYTGTELLYEIMMEEYKIKLDGHHKDLQ